MPIDTLASDLWHWQVGFVHDDLVSVEEAVRSASGQNAAPAFVSPGIVEIDDRASALMLRDPDGHAAVLHRVRRAPQGATYGN